MVRKQKSVLREIWVKFRRILGGAQGRRGDEEMRRGGESRPGDEERGRGEGEEMRRREEVIQRGPEEIWRRRR